MDPDGPRQVWWFFAQSSGELHHGTDIMAQVQPDRGGRATPVCTNIHLFSHRYARGKTHVESNKDLMTYHSACLLEWDHGQHCTVVELATLNGVGGRKGKSNWCHDKLAERSALYQAFPREMVMPWNGALAEIRCVDVEARSLEEFKAYVQTYTGPAHRFLDPHFHDSGPARLFRRSQDDIMRYLINYMGRDRRYTELIRNCQAFACDFYSFMAGKKDVVPYTAVIRAQYQNRSHLFLYDPDLYSKPAVEY